MDNFTLVRPEHINHHGALFGGQMLKWVDEFAWLTASRDFPHCRLVTIAMDDIVFRHPAPCGSILRFNILLRQQGTTSLTYSVDVYSDAPGAESEQHIFSTTITFVAVDEKGQKTSLPASGPRHSHLEEN
jgi:acyl-CoA hydrolase